MPSSYRDTRQAAIKGGRGQFHINLGCLIIKKKTHTHTSKDVEAHLDDNAGRLGEVPERQAEQTHERRLGLVRLRASSAEDAAA